GAVAAGANVVDYTAHDLFCTQVGAEGLFDARAYRVRQGGGIDGQLPAADQQRFARRRSRRKAANHARNGHVWWFEHSESALPKVASMTAPRRKLSQSFLQ